MQAHFTGSAQLAKASFDRIWFCEESGVGFVVHVAFTWFCFIWEGRNGPPCEVAKAEVHLFDALFYSNNQDCYGRGKPLGMSNGLIPDSSIRASSQRDQRHAAHYGRLGGNAYWCSKNEISSHMEIDLPKKYKITAVTIEAQDISNIRWILLYTHLLRKWIHFHTEWVISAWLIVVFINSNTIIQKRYPQTNVHDLQDIKKLKTIVI